MNRLAGIAIALGGYLIWCGATGNVKRSNFTGEPLISGTVYLVAGGFLVLAGVGLFVGSRWLVQSQTE